MGNVNIERLAHSLMTEYVFSTYEALGSIISTTTTETIQTVGH